MFPKDNQLGVFLDYPEASCTPPKMSPRADFKLILVNHQDPSKPYIKGGCWLDGWGSVCWGVGEQQLCVCVCLPTLFPV